MKYDMIAIDMDGTLLSSDGTVSVANQEAVRRAVEAGVLVVPCTGRGWCEANKSLDPIRDVLDVGIFVTGAAISEIESGKTTEISEMEPHLAHELIEFLAKQPEAVLVFRDRDQVGHDYLITGSCELVGNSSWWFSVTDTITHTQYPLTPEDLHGVLRVGMVATGERYASMTGEIEKAFGDRILAQHFIGIQMPEDMDSVYILEVFAGGVDKWQGITNLASQRNIPLSRVACIGDQINDVTMVSNAALGVAMGNAVPETTAVCDQRTLTNEHDGVAHAINKMLDGEW